MYGGSAEGKTNEALYTKGISYKGNRNTKKGVCYYCQKEGHYAKNCFKKKSDQRKGLNKSPRESANQIEAVVDSNPEIAAAEISQLALATSTESNRVDDNWWIHSGATQHMTPEKDKMQNFVEFGSPGKVQLADNSILHSYGKGDLKMTVYDGSKEINLNLSNVLYVPKSKKLLSLPTLTEKGAEVRFNEKSFIVILNGEMYCIGHKAGKMYILNAEPIYESNLHLSTKLMI